MYGTYLHEYGHYDQSIGAFSSFCVICVQLVIIVDQLNLEHTEKGHVEVLVRGKGGERNHNLTRLADNLNTVRVRLKAELRCEYKLEILELNTLLENLYLGCLVSRIPHSAKSFLAATCQMI